MTAGPSTTLRHSATITLDQFERIVWDRVAVALHPELLQHLATVRDQMLAALRSGRPVYGITTGMGYLAGVQLSEEEQQHHQANLLRGRAVGGPPYLDATETRALLLARLAGFLHGHAGVTPELCQFLAARLNDGFTPAIPRTGIGCAGEIIPLAHAFGPFTGLGKVLGPDDSLHDAAEALARRNVPPYRPASKEGIALLAGAPGALALAIVHRRVAVRTARQILVASACAIDALQAPLAPYQPAIAQLAADPMMAGLLSQLNVLLAGSESERPIKQAPISFRVIPPVLSRFTRVLSRLEESIGRALDADTDSPAFLDGHFISSGGFHAIDLAADMDALCLTHAQVAELAGQQVHRLLDARFSRLPDQLTPHPGLHAGLVTVHKRMVGVIGELRRLATPSTIGLVDTSLGQEDAMTFAFEVAEKLRRSEELLREVIACELLVVRQAWALRGARIASGLQQYASQLAALVEPVDLDRPLGDDIAALTGALAAGEFR